MVSMTPAICAIILAGGFISAKSIASVPSTPAGAGALQDWFNQDILPRIFPNATSDWLSMFEDGTIHPDITFSLNDSKDQGRESFKAHMEAANNFIVQSTEYFIFEVKNSFSHSFDDEGHTGLVVSIGELRLKTTAGEELTGGGAASFAEVGWDSEGRRRVLMEWREANSPPN